MSEWLIKLGKREFKETFSGDPVADALLADFDNTPHAFVLGCLMDRGIPAEKAWALPRKIFEEFGSVSIEDLQKYSLQEWVSLFDERKWHPYGGEQMGKVAHHAVRDIAEKYDGNAAKIWDGNPSSGTVVYRFLEFRGVAQKISSMAANILVRHFRIPMSDHCGIDISVDTHTKRVVKRMGLVPQSATKEMIIWKARGLHPKYPGIFDYICWKIGREFCHQKKAPNCEGCPVRSDCPKIGVN